MKSEDAAAVRGISIRKIDRTQGRLVEEGLSRALTGRKRARIDEKTADGEVEAYSIGFSCTDPPEGHASYSLWLLADRAVELRCIDSISHETVRRLLKKLNASLETPRMSHSSGANR